MIHPLAYPSATDPLSPSSIAKIEITKLLRELELILLIGLALVLLLLRLRTLRQRIHQRIINR